MSQTVDIKRVQDVLFDMACHIAAVLEKHDIPHMITYGTLLGAIRHKDFIPWDDDFDFYLFDDSYDQAIEYLRAELPQGMFVEDAASEPLYFHGWAHVKDLRSVAACEAFPQDGLYAHKGVSVDLYRTKKMTLAELEPFLNDENEAYLNRRRSKGLISDVDYQIRIERLKASRLEEDKYAGDTTEVYNIVPVPQCHYVEAEYIFPLRRYGIRDKQFWGPKDGEMFLRKRYGDFMTLPPVEQRVGHYSSVDFLD